MPGKRKGSITTALKIPFPGKFTLTRKNAPEVPRIRASDTAHTPTIIE